VNDVTRSFLTKAERAIGAADNLLASGDSEFAVGRAYYAMFYVAEALLNERGLRFKKHGGVHGAFGENFAKAGTMDAKFHRWLLDAFDKRITGDYGVDSDVSQADAAQVIEHAREFLSEARKFLGEPAP
jgi:uncharacterized protein (UPF0332 family)